MTFETEITKEDQIEAAWREHRGAEYTARVAEKQRLRDDLAKRLGWICPICIESMKETVTLDHILPRAWGGTDWLHGSVRNLRAMCQTCNERRARYGHCLGALACAVSS